MQGSPLKIRRLKYSTFMDYLTFVYTTILHINESNKKELISVARQYKSDAEIRYEMKLGCTGKVDPIHAVQISTNLERFFDGRYLSDVCFIVEGSKLYAHKIVLAARCLYFRAMFFSKMKEAIASVISVRSTRFSVFYTLIEYLYSDKVSFGPRLDDVTDLLQLSSEYNVDRLKEMCEKELARYVDVKTVLHIASIAEKVNANQLFKYCAYIMQKEHVILSQSGTLLELPPNQRKKVLKFTKYAAAQNKFSKRANSYNRTAFNPQVIIPIFSFLEFKDLLAIQLVCNHWRYISERHSWEAVVKRHWRVEHYISQNIESWKHYYMYLLRQDEQEKFQRKNAKHKTNRHRSMLLLNGGVQ